MDLSIVHLVLFLTGIAACCFAVLRILRERRFKAKVAELGFEFIGDGEPFRVWGDVSVPPQLLTRLEGTRIENLSKGRFHGMEAELFDLSVHPSENEVGEVLARRLTVVGFRRPGVAIQAFLQHRGSSKRLSELATIFESMPELEWIEQAGDWTIFYNRRVTVEQLSAVVKTAHEWASLMQIRSGSVGR